MVSCPTKHREQTQGRVFRVIDYYVTLDDRCQRPAVKLSAVPFGTILSCPLPVGRIAIYLILTRLHCGISEIEITD